MEGKEYNGLEMVCDALKLAFKVELVRVKEEHSNAVARWVEINQAQKQKMCRQERDALGAKIHRLEVVMNYMENRLNEK